MIYELKDKSTVYSLMKLCICMYTFMTTIPK